MGVQAAWGSFGINGGNFDVLVFLAHKGTHVLSADAASLAWL